MSTTLKTEHIKCEKSVITQIADDILYIDVRANQEFDMEDYRDILFAVNDLGHGKKFKHLMHVGMDTLPTNEVRHFITTAAASKYKIADAFVVNSLAQNIIARFIIKFQRPKVPTGVFRDDHEALLWLESI